jgi:hypothetical protein
MPIVIYLPSYKSKSSAKTRSLGPGSSKSLNENQEERKAAGVALQEERRRYDAKIKMLRGQNRAAGDPAANYLGATGRNPNGS